MDKKRFLEIDGLEVEVTEEVYKEYMRPIWREEKRVQRLYKDFNNTDELYTKSRSLKEGFIEEAKGLPLSLDKALENSSFEPEDLEDVFLETSYLILLEQLYEVLKSFREKDMRIMKLHLINEFSQREIAKELGISQKTVSNRIKKLLPLIQEKLKNWI